MLKDIKVDFQYPEKLHELPNDLLFLPGRMENKKAGKRVTNLHDETDDVIHINWKQALNHGLILKKLMKSLNLIKKKAWLKPYIDMNTNLDKKQKIILRETFSSRWIMQFLERLLKCDKK